MRYFWDYDQSRKKFELRREDGALVRDSYTNNVMRFDSVPSAKAFAEMRGVEFGYPEVLEGQMQLF